MGKELGEVAAEVNKMQAAVTGTSAKVFYRGERRCRSLRRFVAFLMITFLTGAFAGTLLLSPGWVERALGTCICVAYLLVGWRPAVRFLFNRIDYFEIRGDGLVQNGALRSWNRIRHLGGLGRPTGHRVVLFFSSMASTTWRCAVHELPEDRVLTPEDFDRFMERLRLELSYDFPHLKIGEYLELSGD